MSKTKLFIVPGRNAGETAYDLVAETGEHLASHFCSNASFAMGDLVANRPERQEEFAEKYGEYEVMFLEDQDEVTQQELVKRNKKWYEENNETV